MLRVRFAPSPTGFLHIGSARTFIFNWLYARHNGGVMILRIDDTDVERNTQASLDSIFEGLRWLDLGWDEEYRQSERLALHRKTAEAIFQQGAGLPRFHPAPIRRNRTIGARRRNLAFQLRTCASLPPPRATAAPPPASRFVLRFRVPREAGSPTSASPTPSTASNPNPRADIEDFALLRSNGMPTYHLASCADDADLRISHIIRGQDHLTNTFKHVLIFEAAGVRRAAVRAPAACWSRPMAPSSPSAGTARW